MSGGAEGKGLIVIYGATGGVGRWILHTILQDLKRSQGIFPFKYRLPVRDEERAGKLFKSLGLGIEEFPREIEVVKGDLGDPASIENVIEGATGVIVTVGMGYSVDGGILPKAGVSRNLEELGISNLAEIAQKKGTVKHIALVSSMFVLRPSHPVNKILNFLFDRSLLWKQRGESALRASGISYTIIRPANLDKISPYPTLPEHFVGVELPEGSPQADGEWDSSFVARVEDMLESHLAIDQGDRATGHTHRKDVALICLLSFIMPKQFGNLTLDVFEKVYAGTKNPAAITVEEEFKGKRLFERLLRETKPMPKWEIPSEVSSCPDCNWTFWIASKQQCRMCGRVVCSGCSSKTAPIPEYGLPYPVRICNSCFEKKTD